MNIEVLRHDDPRASHRGKFGVYVDGKCMRGGCKTKQEATDFADDMRATYRYMERQASALKEVIEHNIQALGGK